MATKLKTRAEAPPISAAQLTKLWAFVNAKAHVGRIKILLVGADYHVTKRELKEAREYLHEINKLSWRALKELEKVRSARSTN